MPGEQDLGVFVRKTTGLVRSFSVVDVVIFNLLVLSPGYALASGVLATYFWPGVNLAVTQTFGMCFALFVGLTVGLLAAAMPMSGGEYVYISKTTRPALGFTVNFGMTIAIIMFQAVTVLWLTSWTLATLFATYGALTANTFLSNLGILFTKPNVVFAVGVAVDLVFAAILSLGTKVSRNFLRIMMIPTFGTLALTGILFATTSNHTFISNFNHLFPSTSYQGIISTASSIGFTPNLYQFSLIACILAMPLGFWMYAGFSWSSYIGGEVRTPRKSQPYGITLALLIAWIIEVAIVLMFYNVVGWNFVSAIGHLSYFAPSHYPLPVAPTMALFSAVLTLNPILNILQGIGWFSWLFACAFVCTMIPIRNTFVWAFDRIIPEKMASVNDKTGSPSVATGEMIAIGIIFLALFAFTRLFTYMFNYIIAYAFAGVITGIAGMLFPFVRKDVFEASPPIVKTKIGELPFISLAGAICSGFFAFIVYTCLAVPAWSGFQGPIMATILVIQFSIGVVIFYAVRSYRRKQGINLDNLFREIPSE
jgi:amino acid transporter